MKSLKKVPEQKAPAKKVAKKSNHSGKPGKLDIITGKPNVNTKRLTAKASTRTTKDRYTEERKRKQKVILDSGTEYELIDEDYAISPVEFDSLVKALNIT